MSYMESLVSYMPCCCSPSTGRVASGSVKVGDPVKVLHHDGSPAEAGRITRILKRTSGFNKSQLEAACAGDVVELAGLATAGGQGLPGLGCWDTCWHVLPQGVLLAWHVPGPFVWPTCC